MKFESGPVAAERGDLHLRDPRSELPNGAASGCKVPVYEELRSLGKKA